MLRIPYVIVYVESGLKKSKTPFKLGSGYYHITVHVFFEFHCVALRASWSEFEQTLKYKLFSGQTTLCRKASVLFLIWDVSLVDGNLMQIPAASSLLVAFLLEVPWVASVVRSRLCNLLERSFWQHYPGFELKTRSLITRNPHRCTVYSKKVIKVSHCLYFQRLKLSSFLKK